MDKKIKGYIVSIINDVNKLKFSKEGFGIVSFVLFPIPYNDNRWIKYLNRISSEVHIHLSREKNCSMVDIYINNISSQTVVCSFLVR